MVEGLSALNGPIPQDPIFGKNYNFSSHSARSNYSICEGPSKISGPIASHYNQEDEKRNGKIDKSSIDYAQHPKVRGDGFANFQAHKNGNGVSLLINSQPKQFTFRQRRKPKNYIASNTVKIRELMKKVREREQNKQNNGLGNDKSVPVKALCKFDHVESKVKDLMINDPKTPRAPKYEFLKAHSRPGSANIARPHTAREVSTDANQDLKIALKKRAKDDIDFIKQNQMLANQMRIRRAPSVEMLKNLQEKTNKDFEAYMNNKKGKIPEYIEKRREEIRKAQIEYQKNIPDPDQPLGHRKLPDEERIATLNLLQETHKKMIGELNSLPIRDDTFRIRQTKSGYEKRLAEVEEAIKIFSKAKVFVKIDE